MKVRPGTCVFDSALQYLLVQHNKQARRDGAGSAELAGSDPISAAGSTIGQTGSTGQRLGLSNASPFA